MKNIYRIAIFTVAVSVAALLPMRIVWSSDENASVAQVYLEFDPATGQFVSVPVTDANNVDPESIVKRNNTAATQTAQPSTQDTTVQQTQTAPATTTGAVDIGGSASNGVSPMLIVSIVAVGLFGGIVLMMRKKTA